jgi:hypothetical protein
VGQALPKLVIDCLFRHGTNFISLFFSWLSLLWIFSRVLISKQVFGVSLVSLSILVLAVKMKAFSWGLQLVVATLSSLKDQLLFSFKPVWVVLLLLSEF